jgi:hypothetical protein
MSILFLKTPPIGSFVRPSGYAFPTGLFNIGDAANGPTSVDYLVVAGGGGGNSNYAGGGGAGGFLTGTAFSVTQGTPFAITVPSPAIKPLMRSLTCLSLSCHTHSGSFLLIAPLLY